MEWLWFAGGAVLVIALVIVAAQGTNRWVLLASDRGERADWLYRLDAEMKSRGFQTKLYRDDSDTAKLKVAKKDADQAARLLDDFKKGSQPT
ncbi:hypothetical protein BG53_13615 [Paenibacillus darwinianus]|uniref:Uncharacterized protein n=1 Tax=Paenibacillus darwinianus TaxID=1380763 RepID=A0A9W5W806_9BACL|nr:hypothetical protein [Paenibacillus darwinianus]EXX90421.1 hypothetical protein BG53_13615 [Paenibacillus darwinianus]EXX91108.1 hypothetical protein BG52_11455 [Paenibacillus darwinianus]EXX92025.1 hypothetical protein CH50_12260 [Paenibacillus darwinianus]